MLWNSQANDITNKLFKDAQDAANQRRKEDSLKRLEYYRDGQLPYLMDALAQRFQKPEKLQPLFINVVKKIVNIKAASYLEPPMRELMDNTERDKMIYQEIMESSALSMKMKMASRLVKLLKTVMLRPVWRNGRLDLDILPPDILDVETGTCPEDVLAVMVTHYKPKMEEITYELVTPDSIKILDYRGHLVQQEDNPYQIIPFIPLWDTPPFDQFFQEAGDDLIASQDALNVLLTSLVYTCEMQGYSVGYVKTESGDSLFSAGPGQMYELSIDGEIGFVAPNAPISDVLKAVEFTIKQTAIANGLSASSLSTEPTKETGISRVVGNRELMEQRADEIELFRVYERRLFETMRVVWNAHNPARKLTDKARLKIDFADLREATSLNEQIAAWDSLLAMNVINRIDIIMERNKDLKTREEALNFLKKMEKEDGNFSPDSTTYTASDKTENMET